VIKKRGGEGRSLRKKGEEKKRQMITYIDNKRYHLYFLGRDLKKKEGWAQLNQSVIHIQK